MPHNYKVETLCSLLVVALYLKDENVVDLLINSPRKRALWEFRQEHKSHLLLRVVFIVQSFMSTTYSINLSAPYNLAGTYLFCSLQCTRCSFLLHHPLPALHFLSSDARLARSRARQPNTAEQTLRWWSVYFDWLYLALPSCSKAPRTLRQWSAPHKCSLVVCNLTTKARSCHICHVG